MKWLKKGNFFLSLIVVFALHCKFEVVEGGFPASNLLNGLNKLLNTFNAPDYLDLLALAAVYMLLRMVAEKDSKLDIGTGILSIAFSTLLVTCISFKKYNHAGFLFANSFQLLISGFCILGFGVLIYIALRLFYLCLEGEINCKDVVVTTAGNPIECTTESIVEPTAESIVEMTAESIVEPTAESIVEMTVEEDIAEPTAESLVENTAEGLLESTTEGMDVNARKMAGLYDKHFFAFGFGTIVLGWLFWILLNYPGSSCPDSILQLQQFLGDAQWGAGHPPLSSAIMGVLFTIGRTLVNANFGYFLYCFFQTLVGAGVFAYCMRKLQKLGIPLKWCTIGIIYFAFTPFWGTYAQWFEKDLLYAVIATLQAVCMLEIIRKRSCTGKEAIVLTLVSLLASLLRNNGIYAVVPALFLLIFWVKGVHRKRIVISLIATVVLFQGITGPLFSLAFGISKPSSADILSPFFQQTARYVCEYGEEVTEHERQVIDDVLNYDAMVNYDPVISDPIKILYRGGDLSEYWKIWFGMFLKHPGCYVASFINNGYGYLAPVSQNIEGWIQMEYPEYIRGLGIHHSFGISGSLILSQLWNISMQLPLIKYLCTPGLYTWILLALALLLWKHRKMGALILLVPSAVNILVCLASPLATAIRYELPTVAVIPLLIGWTYYALHEKPSQQ